MNIKAPIIGVFQSFYQLVVSTLDAAAQSVKERDNGKTSSSRIVLFVALYMTYDLIQFWKDIVLIEVQRETERDLTGIAAIGAAIIPILLTAVIGKIVGDKLKQ